MANPRISVVMPVYNVELYVADAIRSVLRQSFTDFELIVVDDGGSDGSMEIVRSFHDPRIRVLSQPNRGLAGARNTGIAAARGDYIALLDSDDCFHPDKLRLHFIHLEANRAIGVSYAGSRLIDRFGNALSVAMRPQLTGITPGLILQRNPVGNGSAAVLRRRDIDRAAFSEPGEPDRICWFDESFRQSEDIEFWTRLAVRHRVAFEGIEGLLTDYRIVSGALSANIVQQYLSWEAMLRKVTAYAPEFAAQYGTSARAYQLRYLARRAIQLGDTQFASSLMAKALRTGPHIVVAEPIKTMTTLGAVVAGNLLGAERFRELARVYLKEAA
ncbi:glycosyltransferase [Erythrobacter sp. SG61-1L]|uniref:glycosyltransferase family 2 protein n=1 Tax=Erythrobacter sp. SG61-1L TaxID=1603897 RepID=UPI0006C90AB2|nr:glycosyltransferase [Erythrobacter sp. SG61-1L]